MNRSIEYADRLYESMLRDTEHNSALKRIEESPTSVRYELHGEVGMKNATLVYLLQPYQDESGGDATFFVPELPNVELRFEQEDGIEGLNADTDAVFTYFKQGLSHQLRIITKKFMWVKHYELIAKEKSTLTRRNGILYPMAKIVADETFIPR